MITVTAWFARNRQPIIIGTIIFALIVIMIVMSKCDDWRNRSAVEAQAKQTTASSDATAEAAENAIATVINRNESDNLVDAAVTVAQEEIGNAETPDDIRRAVVDAMCLRDTSYCDDTARKVR